jgi:hypothetical protein
MLGGKKIEKKIVCIVFCTLLIIGTTIPLTTAMSVNNHIKQVVDQSQETQDECAFFPNYAWQQFVPTGTKLIKVDVKIAQWYGGSPDLKMTIEQPLGTPHASASLPASSIPSGNCDWVTFDTYPDIPLTPGVTYHIVLSYDPGGEYGWAGAWGDPYTPGISDRDVKWDWCFRTYVEKSRPKTHNPIFKDNILLLEILQNLMNRFPILLRILYS